MRIGIAVLSLGLLLGGTVCWVTLMPPGVRLRIETIPPGGEIWMNGEHLGVTPLELDLSKRVVPFRASDGRHPFPDQQGCVVNAMYGVNQGYWESVLELDPYLRTAFGLLRRKADGGSLYLILRPWKIGRLRFHARLGTRDAVGVGAPPEVEEVGWTGRNIRLVIPLAEAEEEGLDQGKPHWLAHHAP